MFTDCYNRKGQSSSLPYFIHNNNQILFFLSIFSFLFNSYLIYMAFGNWPVVSMHVEEDERLQLLLSILKIFNLSIRGVRNSNHNRSFNIDMK